MNSPGRNKLTLEDQINLENQILDENAQTMAQQTLKKQLEKAELDRLENEIAGGQNNTSAGIPSSQPTAPTPGLNNLIQANLLNPQATQNLDAQTPYTVPGMANQTMQSQPSFLQVPQAMASQASQLAQTQGQPQLLQQALLQQQQPPGAEQQVVPGTLNYQLQQQLAASQHLQQTLQQQQVSSLQQQPTNQASLQEQAVASYLNQLYMQQLVQQAQMYSTLPLQGSQQQALANLIQQQHVLNNQSPEKPAADGKPGELASANIQPAPAQVQQAIQAQQLLAPQISQQLSQTMAAPALSGAGGLTDQSIQQKIVSKLMEQDQMIQKLQKEAKEARERESRSRDPIHRKISTVQIEREGQNDNYRSGASPRHNKMMASSSKVRRRLEQQAREHDMTMPASHEQRIGIHRVDTEAVDSRLSGLRKELGLPARPEFLDTMTHSRTLAPDDIRRRKQQPGSASMQMMKQTVSSQKKNQEKSSVRSQIKLQLKQLAQLSTIIQKQLKQKQMKREKLRQERAASANQDVSETVLENVNAEPKHRSKSHITRDTVTDQSAAPRNVDHDARPAEDPSVTLEMKQSLAVRKESSHPSQIASNHVSQRQSRNEATSPYPHSQESGGNATANFNNSMHSIQSSIVPRSISAVGDKPKLVKKAGASLHPKSGLADVIAAGTSRQEEEKEEDLMHQETAQFDRADTEEPTELRIGSQRKHSIRSSTRGNKRAHEFSPTKMSSTIQMEGEVSLRVAAPVPEAPKETKLEQDRREEMKEQSRFSPTKQSADEDTFEQTVNFANKPGIVITSPDKQAQEETAPASEPTSLEPKLMPYAQQTSKAQLKGTITAGMPSQGAPDKLNYPLASTQNEEQMATIRQNKLSSKILEKPTEKISFRSTARSKEVASDLQARGQQDSVKDQELSMVQVQVPPAAEVEVPVIEPPKLQPVKEDLHFTEGMAVHQLPTPPLFRTEVLGSQKELNSAQPTPRLEEPEPAVPPRIPTTQIENKSLITDEQQPEEEAKAHLDLETPISKTNKMAPKIKSFKPRSLEVQAPTHLRESPDSVIEEDVFPFFGVPQLPEYRVIEMQKELEGSEVICLSTVRSEFKPEAARLLGQTGPSVHNISPEGEAYPSILSVSPNDAINPLISGGSPEDEAPSLSQDILQPSPDLQLEKLALFKGEAQAAATDLNLVGPTPKFSNNLQARLQSKEFEKVQLEDRPRLPSQSFGTVSREQIQQPSQATLEQRKQTEEIMKALSRKDYKPKPWSIPEGKSIEDIVISHPQRIPLPIFNKVYLIKSEYTMVEEDSETDGYLSESEDKSIELFGAPMGASIFTMKKNNSLKKLEEMQLQQLDELLDSSLKPNHSKTQEVFKSASIDLTDRSPSTTNPNNKTAKQLQIEARKMKMKADASAQSMTLSQKREGQLQANDGSSSSDSETNERFNSFDVQKSMLKTQRAVLMHVKEVAQLKNQELLICRSAGGLYEYLQEYRQEISHDSKGILRINDPRKIYFEVFVIILAIYNCYGIPFEICFSPPAMESTGFMIFNSIIDVIFGIDIIVQFKTTYYDAMSGDEIFDKELIKWNYLQGRFLVDFLATVPFDTIGYLITRTRNAILPLFSLLKLIRVTRLGRIIEKMNVKKDLKLMMKLAQLIFFLIMYIHCLACVWFLIVDYNEEWVPPLESIVNPDIQDNFVSLFKSHSTTHKYLISVYYSILLLTCNDITPIGNWRILFCTSAVTLGAIINANIFGNMALIIQNMNQQNSEFQESIDLANTAMKNMNLPKKIQKDVINYLKITQASQNGQQEFEYFFHVLSPSLKNQVIQFIFNEQALECSIFEKNKTIIDFFIKALQLLLLDPEYPLINQGEEGKKFYFVKNGELEVYVKHPIEKKEIYVNNLKGGDFFGEFSLLTKKPRSASIRPRTYSMVGFLTLEKFEEMIFMFPEMSLRLKDHMFTYKDKYKTWLKQQLSNIPFMKYLPDKVLDELTIIMKQEFFDENFEIMKQGEYSGKIYILVQGKIEIYVPTSEDLILDTLEEPGCILNQVSVVSNFKVSYSARAKTDLECLTISIEDLMRYKSKSQMTSLSYAIDDFVDKNSRQKNLSDRNERMFFLDYQRQYLARSMTRPGEPRRLILASGSKTPIEILRDAANRCCLLIRFHRKKDNILSDLIAELKRMNVDEEERSHNKMKEVVKSVGPIVLQKLKKLISNRIMQANQDQLIMTKQIKHVTNFCMLINSNTDAFKTSSSKRSPENRQRGKATGDAHFRKSKMQEVQELEDEDSQDSPNHHLGRHQPGFPKTKMKTKNSSQRNTSPEMKKSKRKSSKRILTNPDEDEDFANLDSSRKLL